MGNAESNSIQELADKAGLSLDVIAVALLLADRAAPLTEIARRLGIDRGKLYRLPQFRKAWMTHRLTDDCPLPFGTKDRKGNLEAFGEHFEKI